MYYLRFYVVPSKASLKLDNKRPPAFLSTLFLSTGTESGAGGQAANGKPEDPRSESVKRSSRLSILTPERLLEGLRTFPSRDNGDSKVTVPGHMTWDALMKIGLVYSFVGLVKKIDAKFESASWNPTTTPVVMVSHVFRWKSSVEGTKETPQIDQRQWNARRR